jgi:tetratricopeptide (TPR) repeat protein
VDDRIERAREVYERAVYGGNPTGLAASERDLDAVEADLALARGRLIHARYLEQRDSSHTDPAEDARELVLFERAAHLYRMLGDARGEGEGLFWVGAFHQIIRHDNEAAVPVLERSRELAARADDMLTLSDVLRHLGIAAHAAGRLDVARSHLEDSTRIRRNLGFLPGVAANLIGLAYIAVGDGRSDDARTLIEEAGSLAKDAAPGVMRHVEEARAHLAA